jgi:Ran GTPase-activating protein (RanGAP) involved in mRNA processing and transport
MQPRQQCDLNAAFWQQRDTTIELPLPKAMEDADHVPSSLQKTSNTMLMRNFQAVKLCDRTFGYWTTARLERVLEERVRNNTSLTSLSIEGDAYSAMQGNMFADLLRSLPDRCISLRALKLSWHRRNHNRMDQTMRMEDAQALQALISSCTSLQNLSLETWRMTNSAWDAVTAGISSSSHLTGLDLIADNLGAAKSLGGEVAATLLANTRLQRLNLSSNSLRSSTVAQAIVSALDSNILTHLDLTDNILCWTSLQQLSIAQSLKSNTSLKVLKLLRTTDGTSTQSEVCIALVEALKHNTSLVHLDLSMNHLAHECHAKVLGSMLEHNTCLTHMSIHTILLEGVNFIAQGLSKNACLRHLDLSRNILMEEDLQALGQALRVNTTLETLLLQQVKVPDMPDDYLVHVLEPLAHNTTLKHLDISDNYLTDVEAKALAKALETSCRLHYLDISEHEINADGISTLCEAIAKHTSLVVLNLGTLYAGMCLPPVCSILQHNTSIQSLEMNFQFKLPKSSKFPALLEHNKSIHSLRLESYDHKFFTAVASSLRTNVHLNDVSFASYLKGEAALALGDALKKTPRYHPLTLQGVRLAKKAPLLGLPDREGEDAWEDDEVVAYLQGTHFDKVFAFAMGQHVRLGAMSCVLGLSHDCVRMVFLYFFGLQHDHFEKKGTGGFEYLQVLRHLE